MEYFPKHVNFQNQAKSEIQYLQQNSHVEGVGMFTTSYWTLCSTMMFILISMCRWESRLTIDIK